MDSKTAIDNVKKKFYSETFGYFASASVSLEEWEPILKRIEELERNKVDVYEKINGEWVLQTKGND